MLRILYAGSPGISAVPLREILGDGTHRVTAVLTNPAAPQKRSGVPVPTPVALAAEQHNAAGKNRIEILTPAKLDADVREQVAALEPDILVCFAYGKIFGPKFLSLFPSGAINLHPSLLPLYRGSAPVPAAILNRDSETGITVQYMSREMDSGDILLQKKLPLDGTETAGSLLEKVAGMGGALFLEVLKQIETGTVNPVPQNGQLATYCQMLKKEDGRIDWAQPAADIDARIRAFSPWPGAFTSVKGTVLLIHEASVSAAPGTDAPPGTVIGVDKKEGILVQTGSGILALRNLQWQARKTMGWKDFINGTRDFVSATLES